jgi:5-hydroxyisourate hydrolase-like protein (transthyretin family)
MDPLNRLAPRRPWLISGLLVAFLGLAWLVPGVARAASGPEATTLTIGAPATAALGQRITVQALLVDSHGQPISKAAIDFAMPITFLTGSGKMVIAQTFTDKDGRAHADIQNQTSGDITLLAEFHGNDQYAASSVSAPIHVTGDEQQYAEDIGVHIPLFNAPPSLTAGGNVTVIGAALWPSFTGWPIAAVLITIWALYFLVVTHLFRVAGASDARPAAAQTESGRRP